jgi:hypothetical protein
MVSSGPGELRQFFFAHSGHSPRQIANALKWPFRALFNNAIGDFAPEAF